MHGNIAELVRVLARPHPRIYAAVGAMGSACAVPPRMGKAPACKARLGRYKVRAAMDTRHPIARGRFVLGDPPWVQALRVHHQLRRRIQAPYGPSSRLDIRHRPN